MQPPPSISKLNSLHTRWFIITGQNCLFKSLAEKILEHLLSFRPGNNNLTTFIWTKGSLKPEGTLITTMVSMSDLLTFWSPGKQEETSGFKVWRRRRRCWKLAAPSQIYMISLTHTQTNNKSQSFSPDIQIKTERPSGGGVLLECCVLMTASSQGPWNADQARGALLFTLQPLASILWYKSFFPSSWPGRFHRVSAGLLILAPFMLGWTGWAPDFWHYPCTLSCGIDLALLLLGMHCLMISRAVIGGGLHCAGLT